MELSLRDRKRALRREMTALWESVPADERRIRDSALLEALEDYIRSYRSVFFYVGSGWEIDTLPLIKRCLAENLRVSVPLCAGRGIMTARIIQSVSDLHPGHYDLPEPSPDAPIDDAPELALLPGLAFSEDGYRLGRGMGYYDRWLAAHPGIPTVAMCPKMALREVPHEPLDVPADALLTPDLIITAQNRIR